MELDSLIQQAYSVVEGPKGYYFYTEQDSTYWVYFTEADGFIPSASFAPDALTFGFVNQSESEENCGQKMDPRIMVTILAILYRFLSVYPEKVLFFICDDSGYVKKKRVKDVRLAKRRHEVFVEWFNKWQTTGVMPIEKVDNTLFNSSYISCLFRANNPKGSEIRDTIRQALLEKQS